MRDVTRNIRREKLSKDCAICGEKISFLSENILSRDHAKTKICFTCYEYVATIIKGNKKALEILRGRYRADISPQVVGYIDSLNADADIAPKAKAPQKDEFMDMINGKSTDVQTKISDQNTPITNIIRFDKLADAKNDKLIRIQIICTILMFCSLLGGLLFSFYLFTQGFGVMLGAVMAIVSVGFAIIFYCIKAFLSVILDR